MLQKLKKIKLLLYICLAMFLLYSCTEEKEYLKNNRELKVKEKSFKELLLLKDFNTAYQRVKTEKQKSIASRSALEDEYNFTIVEDKDVKIMDVDGKTFYNILIQRDSVAADFFENLLIMVERNSGAEELSAYIIKYAPQKYEGTNIYNFEANVDKDLTTLFGRITNECDEVCTTLCWDCYAGTEYAFPHSPGRDCDLTNFIFTTCSTVCTDYQGGSLGGGTTWTGGSSNTGSGSGSSTEIVTAPVYGGTLTDGEEKTPCNVLKKKTNDPIYKSKFLALNNPTNFALPYETGFNEIKTAGVSTYPDAFPLPGGTSMNVAEDAINFTHVHNNKPITDEDGNTYDAAVKMLSPADIRVLINGCANNANLAGGSPLDSFATMISNEGIFSLNIINPNFSTIEQGDFNERFKKFERNYNTKVEKIILNFNLTISQRKEKMQKMLLGLINEYGLQNSIGLYEAEVISIGTTKSIKWKNKSLDNSGNLTTIPCPQ